MSIWDSEHRTKTFISGDWTGDSDLIEKLHEWNNSDKFGLSFVDVHDLTQSRDTSYPCSIKASLRQRLNISKTFVLIVGNKTAELTKGSCRYCTQYRSWLSYCSNGKGYDNRSFIEYECEMAVKDYIAGELKRIVVIYNGRLSPDKSLCPEVIRRFGTHIGSDYIGTDGKRYWDYMGIKKAICGIQ